MGGATAVFFTTEGTEGTEDLEGSADEDSPQRLEEHEAGADFVLDFLNDVFLVVFFVVMFLFPLG